MQTSTPSPINNGSSTLSALNSNPTTPSNSDFVQQPSKMSSRKRPRLESSSSMHTGDDNHDDCENGISTNQENKMTQGSSSTNSTPSGTSLTYLCVTHSWEEAKLRAQTHPHEAQMGITSQARTTLFLLPSSTTTSITTTSNNNNDDSRNGNSHYDGTHNSSSSTTSTSMASSPLALACRYCAPLDTIQAILNANIFMLRRCIPHRGTPLHEAIMMIHDNDPNKVGFQNWEYFANTIQYLVHADENMSSQEGKLLDNKNNNTDISMNTTTYGKRATLIQDLDGHVPLHLLVRETFYHLSYDDDLIGIEHSPSMTVEQQLHIEAIDQLHMKQNALFKVLHVLVESSPESVGTPDCTEYEETPLILALKGHMYVRGGGAVNMANRLFRNDNHQLNNVHNNANGGDVDTQSVGITSSIISTHMRSPSSLVTTAASSCTTERIIFEICKIMLKAYPQAASLVSARSGYTAVHSAVFHGRCCDTIRLVLNADCCANHKCVPLNCCGDDDSHNNLYYDHGPVDNPHHHSSKHHPTKLQSTAAMRANSLGEVPLHFAAMRGECTRTIALLSQAAPRAILKRDSKLGMTPMHWLWVRFVDTMSERFGDISFRNCGDDDENDDDYINHNSKLSTCRDMESDAKASTLNTSHMTNQPSPTDVYSSKLSSTNISSAFLSFGKDNNHINFDLEYHIRTAAIDPPVDYMRMRLILPEHEILEEKLINRVIYILKRVRQRHQLGMKLRHVNGGRSSCPIVSHSTKSHEINDDKAAKRCPFSKSVEHSKMINVEAISKCPFVFDSYPINVDVMGSNQYEIREEQAISLFWAKVTSLLHAAATALLEDCLTPLHDDEENVLMLHTACSAPCSPLSIVKLCVGLYPEQLVIQDFSGKLPLHHVVCRSWHSGDFYCHNKCNRPNASSKITDNETFLGYDHDEEDVSTENSSTQSFKAENLTKNEASKILALIIKASPPQTAKTLDSEMRLPLHHAIDTVMEALCCLNTDNPKLQQQLSNGEINLYESSFNYLKSILKINPDALDQRDGRTLLYPFMQAAAAFSKYSSKQSLVSADVQNASLSIVYNLLRGNPTLVQN